MSGLFIEDNFVVILWFVLTSDPHSCQVTIVTVNGHLFRSSTLDGIHGATKNPWTWSSTHNNVVSYSLLMT